MNRRQFLKTLGATVAVATVAPSSIMASAVTPIPPSVKVEDDHVLDAHRYTMYGGGRGGGKNDDSAMAFLIAQLAYTEASTWKRLHPGQVYFHER